MKSRCENSNNKRDYPNYGGRGIAICDRWQVFENFFADVGERPSAKHEIDRIDNNGNYEPGNVRWALKQVQIRNRRPISKTASQYRGVDFWKKRYWRARYSADGKLYYIGVFDNEIDAALAYDEVVRPLGFPTNFAEDLK